MIKQSILLSSHEIDHIKEKMIELEKGFIDRLMGMEEGLSILTRVIHAIEGRLTYSSDRVEEDRR
jgi:hypothetical protein